MVHLHQARETYDASCSNPETKKRDDGKLYGILYIDSLRTQERGGGRLRAEQRQHQHQQQHLRRRLAWLGPVRFIIEKTYLFDHAGLLAFLSLRLDYNK